MKGASNKEEADLMLFELVRKGEAKVPQRGLKWQMAGKACCREAFRVMVGIGKQRFRSLEEAAELGHLKHMKTRDWTMEAMLRETKSMQMPIHSSATAIISWLRHLQIQMTTAKRSRIIGLAIKSMSGCKAVMATYWRPLLWACMV